MIKYLLQNRFGVFPEPVGRIMSFSGCTVGTAFMWAERSGNIQIVEEVHSPQWLKRHCTTLCVRIKKKGDSYAIEKSK